MNLPEARISVASALVIGGGVVIATPLLVLQLVYAVALLLVLAFVR